MPFTVDAFGVEMEILADGCSLEFEEYRDLYHSLFGASAHGRIKLKTPLPQASKNNRRHMNLQKPRSTDGVLFHFPPPETSISGRQFFKHSRHHQTIMVMFGAADHGKIAAAARGRQIRKNV